MKAYIIKGRSISFRIRQCGKQSDLRQAVIELQMNSNGVTPFDSADQSADDAWTESLFTKLQGVFGSADTGRIVERFASISFQNVRVAAASKDFGFRICLQGGILQEIQKVLGQEVRVTVEIENLYHEESLYPSAATSPSHLCNGKSQLPLQTEEYKVLPLSSNWGPGSHYGTTRGKISTKEMDITISRVTALCEDVVDFPKCWEESWCNYLDWMYWEYKADVNVIISLKPEGSHASKNARDIIDVATVVEIFTLNRKILMEQRLTDVEIITANGATLRCHGIFLAAQSEILMSMMVQNQVTRIYMDNMSEKSVEAFLAFLYCRDTEEATKNASIALELLRASVRYGVASMEHSMTSILMDKPCSEFEVEIALNLFHVVSKNQKFKDLKRKAMQILKTKFHEMPMSAFLSQFRDNREAAKELMDAFFESSQ